MIFDASLARDADGRRLVDERLETTARHLETITPEDDAEPSTLDTIAG